MRQKVFSIFALLLMAATGAWAQTTVTWDSNTWADWTDNSVKTHTVDGVTVTAGGNVSVRNSEGNLYMSANKTPANTITFSSDAPFNRIEFTKVAGWGGENVSPLDGWSVSDDGATVILEGTATKSLVCETSTLYVSKIKFYLESSLDFTEVTAGKEWKIESMPASDVELEIEYKADLTLTVSIEGWTYGATASAPTVSGNEGNGAVTYEYKWKDADDDTYTADVPTAAGDYTVRATVAETDDYADATATADFTIQKAAATISYAETAVTKTQDDEAFTNELTVTGDGIVTYASDNVNVAVVDSETGLVTITGTGTATIKATVADGTNYTYATKTAQYTLTVTAATSIKAIDNGQPATDSTEDYYDLSGRRVSKPTKGVFIQNGKKVVIK